MQNVKLAIECDELQLNVVLLKDTKQLNVGLTNRHTSQFILLLNVYVKCRFIVAFLFVLCKLFG